VTEPFQHLSDGIKHFIDSLSLMAALGTLASVLPPLAAALSIAWTLLRFYEWFRKRHDIDAQ